MVALAMLTHNSAIQFNGEKIGSNGGQEGAETARGASSAPLADTFHHHFVSITTA